MPCRFTFSRSAEKLSACAAPLDEPRRRSDGESSSRMEYTEGSCAQLLPWPCSHIWMRMRQACGKHFRVWSPPIRMCNLKRRNVTKSMNGNKGVSVGGRKNVLHSTGGRGVASATNSVHSVESPRKKNPYVSVYLHTSRYMRLFQSHFCLGA